MRTRVTTGLLIVDLICPSMRSLELRHEMVLQQITISDKHQLEH